MDPTSFFGQNILAVLGKLRSAEEIVDYSKVEGDEFLKLPERGFYLHSKNGNGVIFDCRIYFVGDEEYFLSRDSVRGKFASISNISDLENMLGACVREIKSVRIPTRPPTLPGKEFVDGINTVKAFMADGENISYIHINRRDFS